MARRRPRASRGCGRLIGALLLLASTVRAGESPGGDIECEIVVFREDYRTDRPVYRFGEQSPDPRLANRVVFPVVVGGFDELSQRFVIRLVQSGDTEPAIAQLRRLHVEIRGPGCPGQKAFKGTVRCHVPTLFGTRSSNRTYCDELPKR